MPIWHLIVTEAFLTATFIGVTALLLRQSLLHKIFAIDLISTSMISLFVIISAEGGIASPILNPGRDSDIAFSDPFPQAVILTAIVIGFSVQALALVVLRLMARDNPLLRVNDFEIH